MNKNLENAIKSGLVDVIKDWMKTEKYISLSSIQRNFSVGFTTASAIFNHLIEEKLIEDKPTYNKGHKVIGYDPLFPMDIYLLDINPEITKAWEKEFASYNNFHIVTDEFKHFMDTHKSIECIVSPANSFGYMNGGYDKAITDYFGVEVEKEVQRFINTHLFGEQPVGTSIMVDIPKTNKKLIHTPTMRLPSSIKDEMIIYQCMRSTLMCAIKGKVKSIVIPAFGGATGKAKPSIIAKYMSAAYKQIVEHIKSNKSVYKL